MFAMRPENPQSTTSGEDSHAAFEALRDTARRYKAEAIAHLLHSLRNRSSNDLGIEDIPDTANIVGVGFGEKVTAGARQNGVHAVRIYVRHKRTATKLKTYEYIPPHMNGLPTDVVPIGSIRSLAKKPIRCGASISGDTPIAGTLGCLLRRKDASDTDRYLLSCFHVLAANLEPVAGAPIFHPGIFDGGIFSTIIAHLTDWVACRWDAPNRIDAAVARLVDTAAFLPALSGIDNLQSEPLPAALYQSARKYGRTTKHTVGIVMDISVDIKVGFGDRKIVFEEQIGIVGAGKIFSSSGDSGALVVESLSRRPLGLLFAGSPTMSLVTPIQSVLDRFGMEIIPNSDF